MSRGNSSLVAENIQMFYGKHNKIVGTEREPQILYRRATPADFEGILRLMEADVQYAKWWSPFKHDNNIGVCLIGLGDTNAAKEQFRESIEFIPYGYNYPDPYRNLESKS